MRKRMIYSLLAIGYVALLGCGSSPSDVVSNIDGGMLSPPCQTENRGTFILHNGKDAELNALIDGRVAATIEPGEDRPVDVPAGVAHEVRFEWTDGTIACFSSAYTVKACESIEIGCL